MLGEGATGRVFEVEDHVRRGRFAAKRLRSERLTAQQIALFKDEFRAVQRLAHPNLVRLYELVSNETGIYILMELIDGLDFVRHARGISAPAIDEPETASDEEAPAPTFQHGEVCIARIRSAASQLVSGLLALHASGKVHCDIKPANVLVTGAGRVVILDFGLVTAGTTRAPGTGRGTPAFMAPEQMEGVVSEAVDWYAGGALLYLALCGQMPLGSSAHAKRSSRPIDPRLVSPDVPDDLAELVLRMLDPDPSARPTDREMAQRFGLPPPGPALGPGPHFLGRGAELGALREMLAEAEAGAGSRVVHIHGESGIGKTSLIEHFTTEAAGRGAIALRGSCYVEASVPYKGLDNVMDRIASDVGQFGVRLDDEEREALATVFSVFGPASESRVQDRHRARACAVSALRALLARLSERAAIIIAIDDFQWADLDSVGFLADVMSSLPLEPLLLVLAYRGDSESGVLRHARASLPPQREIALGPLAESTIGALLSCKLGARELSRLARESRGNPFFLGELLRARTGVYSRGELRLEEVLASRIEELSARQREYLELVCVAGHPLDESVLARALGAPRAEMLEARSQLSASSFIRAGGAPAHTVEPYHDRVREHLLATMRAETVRQRHRALADGYAAAASGDAETLAVHYRAAGELGKARKYLELAGDAAARVLAFEHAANLYGAAIALDQPRARASLRVKYAQALSNAGRAVDAASVYEGLLDEQQGDVSLLLSAGDEYLRAGQIDRGLSFLNRVANTFGESIPRGTVQASLALLWAAVLLTLRLRAKLGDVPIRPKDRLRLDLYYSLAKRVGFVDVIRATLFQVRYLSFALRLGSRPDAVSGFALVGASFSHARRLLLEPVRIARWLIERSDVFARETDPLSVRIATQLSWGLFELASWRWEDAVRRFDRGLALAGSEGAYGLQWEMVYCESMAQLAHWIQGDVAELRRRIMANGATMPAYLGIPGKDVLRVSALIELMDDRPAEASSSVRRAMALWPNDYWCFQHHCSAVALVEIELYQGEVDVAWQRLAAAWKESAYAGIYAIQYVYFSALMLRIRVALAGARWREAHKDIRKMRRGKDAWVRALADIFSASAACARGDAGAAAHQLERAIPVLAASRLYVYALAARYRCAQVRGDALEQRRVLDEVSAQGIRNPERMLHSFLPWAERGEA